MVSFLLRCLTKLFSICNTASTVDQQCVAQCPECVAQYHGCVAQCSGYVKPTADRNTGCVAQCPGCGAQCPGCGAQCPGHAANYMYPHFIASSAKLMEYSVHGLHRRGR